MGLADVGWLGPTRTMRCGLWLHLAQWTRALQELDAPITDRLPAHTQARRLTLRARALAALGQPVQALLEEALVLAPATGRIDCRLLVQLESMHHASPDHVLVLADQIGAAARANGLHGFELWALVRSMGAALQLLGPAELMRRSARVDELAPTTYCYGTSRAELWLAQAAAAHARGDIEAQRRHANEGREWLTTCAQKHVPEPFRDSYLNRNPVNRDLLALASRLLGH